MSKHTLYRMVTGLVLAALLCAGGIQGAPNRLAAAATLQESAAHTWYIEHVDTPHAFSDMGPHSLDFDAQNHPHIAYGGNHLYHAWHDGSAWQVEIADEAWGVGNETSLVVEADGGIHIAYYDSINENLLYAYKASGSTTWYHQVVDGLYSVGWDASLAVGSDGLANIAYYDLTNGAVKFAYDTGGGWYDEVVDSDTSALGLSLALDASDRAHITYLRPVTEFTDDLRYAAYNGSSWEIETVTGPAAIIQPSLALDASGHPHIAYSNGGLQYAVDDGSGWDFTQLDSGYVGYDASLALNSTGLPYISYYDSTNKDLKVAIFNGTSWSVAAVDSGGNVGENSSLALTSSGAVSISYFDATNGTLKYTGRICWPICYWPQGTIVDTSSQRGWYSSLDLTSGNLPRIAYYDAGSQDLRYAYRYAGIWDIAVVDGIGSVGSYTSMALDADDLPAFSYYGGGLKYAYEAGNWYTEQVINDSSQGFETALALDSAGRPHIAYIDYDNDELEYAYYNGTWHFQTVSTEGWIWEHVAIALDAQDHPRILYMDSQNGDISYASYDGSTWTNSLIQHVGSFGGVGGLRIDSSGRPHVSYCANTNSSTYTCNELRYAYLSRGVWYISVVDSGNAVGNFSSLALDAGNNPSISYYADHTLRYAWRVCGEMFCMWYTETVDSQGDTGGYTSLAVGTDGSLHISYYSATGANLRYAYTDPPPPPTYKLMLPMVVR